MQLTSWWSEHDAAEDFRHRVLYDPRSLSMLLGTGAMSPWAYSLYIRTHLHTLRTLRSAAPASLHPFLDAHQAAIPWTTADEKPPTEAPPVPPTALDLLITEYKSSAESAAVATALWFKSLHFMATSLAAFPVVRPAHCQLWIDRYSSAEFGAQVDAVLSLAQPLSLSGSFDACVFSASCLRAFYGIFVGVVKEVAIGNVSRSEFLDIAPQKPESFSFVVDFDETITLKDTTSSILYASARKSKDEEKEKLVSKICETYYESYRAFFTEYWRTFDDSKYPDWNLRNFASSFAEFEEKSVQDTEISRVTAGISLSDLDSLAGSIDLRKGATSFLNLVTDHNHAVTILSVSWSSYLISSRLKSEISKKISILANELQLEEKSDSVSNGKIEKRILHLLHKEKEILKLKSTVESDVTTVYIGDSINDILALFAADIGILIKKESPSLFHFISKLNLCVKPLLHAAFTKTEKHDCIYLASSWKEIEAYFTLTFPNSFHTTSESLERKSEVTTVPKILIVAGSDSGGGAGIQADIKAGEALGVFSTSCITALTAQNTIGVQHVFETPPEVVEKQITSILSDIGTTVVKTGMIPNQKSLASILKALSSFPQTFKLVVDPVMISSSGHYLVDLETIESLKTNLFPLAEIITPNLDEAEALLKRKIASKEDMIRAAHDLLSFGSKWVLVKGGHLSCSDGVSDVLCGNSFVDGVLQVYVFKSERLPEPTTKGYHGTGCTLASAISSCLARRLSISKSVEVAKRYLYRTLFDSTSFIVGKGPSLPLKHSLWWGLRQNLGELPISKSSVSKLPNPVGLYVVTDPDMIDDLGISFEEAIRECLVFGRVKVLQIREKTSNFADFVQKVKLAKRIASTVDHKPLIIVNDRVDVAIASDADGVHLGADDMSTAVARKLLGPCKIIGKTVGNIEEAVAAEVAGADYVGTNAIFATTTKPESPPMGLETLKLICKSIGIPVVAIGGLNLSNCANVLRSGCSGFAVISAVFANPPKSSKIALNCSTLHRKIEEVFSSISRAPSFLKSPNYFAWKTLCKLREIRPLVHCIANYVSMDFMANVLLSIGASPAMVHSEHEVEEFVSISSSLLVNIGTLSEPWIRSMIMAATVANSQKKPWVLDPVGAGATSLRRKTCNDLLDLKPTIVRGNAGEIMFLAGDVEALKRSKGVDAGSNSSSAALDAAIVLAKRTGGVVAVSGEIDLITDGKTVARASGCSVTAIIAAFAAVLKEEPLLAAAFALSIFGAAAEICRNSFPGKAIGPGTLRTLLLDKLYDFSEEDCYDKMFIEISTIE